jgi:hypothetical protein
LRLLGHNELRAIELRGRATAKANGFELPAPGCGLPACQLMGLRLGGWRFGFLMSVELRGFELRGKALSALFLATLPHPVG